MGWESVSAVVVAVFSFAVLSLWLGAPPVFAAFVIEVFGFAAVPVGRFVRGTVYPGRFVLFAAVGFGGFAVAGAVGDAPALLLVGTVLAATEARWAVSHSRES